MGNEYRLVVGDREVTGRQDGQTRATEAGWQRPEDDRRMSRRSDDCRHLWVARPSSNGRVLGIRDVEASATIHRRGIGRRNRAAIPMRPHRDNRVAIRPTWSLAECRSRISRIEQLAESAT